MITLLLCVALSAVPTQPSLPAGMQAVDGLIEPSDAVMAAVQFAPEAGPWAIIGTSWQQPYLPYTSWPAYALAAGTGQAGAPGAEVMAVDPLSAEIMIWDNSADQSRVDPNQPAHTVHEMRSVTELEAAARHFVEKRFGEGHNDDCMLILDAAHEGHGPNAMSLPYDPRRGFSSFLSTVIFRWRRSIQAPNGRILTWPAHSVTVNTITGQVQAVYNHPRLPAAVGPAVSSAAHAETLALGLVRQLGHPYASVLRTTYSVLPVANLRQPYRGAWFVIVWWVDQERLANFVDLPKPEFPAVRATSVMVDGQTGDVLSFGEPHTRREEVYRYDREQHRRYLALAPLPHPWRVIVNGHADRPLYPPPLVEGDRVWLPSTGAWLLGVRVFRRPDDPTAPYLLRGSAAADLPADQVREQDGQRYYPLAALAAASGAEVALNEETRELVINPVYPTAEQVMAWEVTN